MLEMQHVSYGYKDKKRTIDRMVLKDLSLQFKPGVLCCLHGASGVGKTTCLALLGGLETPTEGKILLDGQDIKSIGYNTLRRKYVSYVFQDFHLFPYMTAVENVLMAVRPHKGMDKKACRKKAVELLAELGLEERDMHRRVTKLSGGQKQRVAIARALATDAGYILADEPTGNLDRENTENIIHILKSLAAERNKCIIVVTHSNKVKEASDICISLEDEKDVQAV